MISYAYVILITHKNSLISIKKSSYPPLLDPYGSQSIQLM
jgi:hypothetical protein